MPALGAKLRTCDHVKSGAMSEMELSDGRWLDERADRTAVSSKVGNLA